MIWQCPQFSDTKDVFGMALLALLQNSSVEQLYFRVLVVFNKINVYNSKKMHFEGGKILLPFL
jgi:hypothetical protein